MTIVRGGPAGPDGVGGAYDNEVETDRSAWWYGLGGEQRVLEGFVHSGVAGQMALDFTPGAALVGERAADGTASLDRGYLVWADTTTRVLFEPASAAARNDAVVAAFADTEDGPLGTGVTEVGPQIVVVTGVSGTTTPRTDAQINDWVGRGGWVRLLDVPVASTDTEINVANITPNLEARPGEWRTLTPTSPWTVSSPDVLAVRRTPDGRVSLKGRLFRNSAASGSTACVLPTGYRPPLTVRLAAPGQAFTFVNVEIDSSGNVVPFFSGTPNWVAVDLVFDARP